MAARRSVRSTTGIVLLCLVALATAAACGERASHADVVAVAEGRSLTGDTGVSGDGLIVGPSTVEQPSAVTASTGAAAPTAAIGGGTPTGAVVVPTGAVATGGTTPTQGVTPTNGPPGTTAPRSSTPTSAAAGKQDTTPVVICQVGHFTGIAGPPLSAAQPALSAWVRWTNAHGGLAGHAVQLDSKDDAIDPNKTQQIVQNCVQNEHAVALVGAFVPGTVDSISTYVTQRKIPVVGGDDLTDTWFSNADFYPEGSSSVATGDGVVDIMIKAGKTSAGVIFCTENIACTVGNRNFSAAAKHRGLAVKGTYQVSLASPTFTSQCSSMQSAHIDTVYISLDGPSQSRLARDCNAIGYHPLLVSGGIAFDAVATAKDANLNGLAITTSVFPWMTSASQAAKDFQSAMTTYAPDVSPTEAAAKAWVSGQLLAKALSNVGDAARTGPITSAMIVEGLVQVKNETLGGLVMGHLTFHAGAPATSNDCWGVVTLQGGAWTAPQSATPSCP